MHTEMNEVLTRISNKYFLILSTFRHNLPQKTVRNLYTFSSIFLHLDAGAALWHPELFIKPKELVRELTNAGLVAGPQTGLGPRGINRKGDFVFGPLPLKTVIYMGRATKPKGVN